MSVRSKKLLPFQKKKLSPDDRKFKHFATDLESRRSCGTCTACCDAVGVEDIKKPEFTPCKHLCGSGCGIYRDRPEQCRTYLCAWKAVWTPNDESWRPDNLGVIFDVHTEGLGGRAAIRCWQLRSKTQILDDPKVRAMAFAMAFQFRQPVVARFESIMNISVHLIPRISWIRHDLNRVVPPIPSFLLTPDVISDPQDFDRKREKISDHELNELVNQFGFKALSQHMET